MSFDFKLLGKKLKEARESLMMDASESAAFINLSERDYLQVEKGELEIQGDEIILLAKLFRRNFRYFVTGDYPSAESQINELFRQNSSLSRLDRISIQEFVQLCEYKHYFENLLDIKKDVPKDYSKLKFGTQIHKEQGIQAAYMERERLGIKDGSISNIYSLLRRQKIHIFRQKLEDSNISGVYIKHPIAGHCILINYEEDVYRQNFSVAHEYAHVLFDSKSEQSITFHNNKRNYIETRANNFASHFLLPEQDFNKYPRPMNEENFDEIVLNMLNTFKVSRWVVLIRMSEKGWITENKKNTILKSNKYISPRGYMDDPELSSLSPQSQHIAKKLIIKGVSREYMEICRNVYNDGLVSYAKIMESFQINYEEAIKIMNLWQIYLEVD